MHELFRSDIYTELRDILDNGVWDTDYDVRPVWEDGTLPIPSSASAL